jgi:sRNA-binding carbon storage regulator CsrA
MLNVSHNPKQKVVLITVQVMEIERGLVRRGIENPPKVTVLREDVPDRASEWAEERPRQEEELAALEKERDEFVRQLHDQLKTIGVGLGLLRLQRDVGLAEEAKATLAALHDDFQVLLHGVEGEKEHPLAMPRKKECKPQTPCSCRTTATSGNF